MLYFSLLYFFLPSSWSTSTSTTSTTSFFPFFFFLILLYRCFYCYFLPFATNTICLPLFFSSPAFTCYSFPLPAPLYPNSRSPAKFSAIFTHSSVHKQYCYFTFLHSHFFFPNKNSQPLFLTFSGFFLGLFCTTASRLIIHKGLFK